MNNLSEEILLLLILGVVANANNVDLANNTSILLLLGLILFNSNNRCGCGCGCNNGCSGQSFFN